MSPDFPLLYDDLDEFEWKQALMLLNNSNTLTKKELNALTKNELEQDSLSLCERTPSPVNNDNPSLHEYDVDNNSVDNDEDFTDLPRSLKSTFEDTHEMLRLNDNSHSHLSPQTKKLHKDIKNTCESQMNLETSETIVASTKNMIHNINYIMNHGDILNNKKCAEIARDLEKFITESKNKVIAERYVAPVPKGLSFPAFDSKKPRKVPQQFKGVCG